MPEELLRSSPLFQVLSGPLVKAMAAACRRQKHLPGEELFEAGQPARNLYVLEKGHVALLIHTDAKEEMIISTISSPGDVFAWSSLVEPRILTATAQFLQETSLLSLEASVLEETFDAHPEEGLRFMRRLASLIARRLRETQSRLIGSIT